MREAPAEIVAELKQKVNAANAANNIEELTDLRAEVYLKGLSLAQIKEVFSSLTPETRKAIEQEQEARRERAEAERFKRQLDGAAEQIYKNADFYMEIVGAIENIIPGIKELDGKQISKRLQSSLDRYETGNYSYAFSIDDDRIALLAFMKCKLNKMIFLICKHKSYLSDDESIDKNRKINADIMIKELEESAEAYKQEAAEARQNALELFDDVKEFERLMKAAEAIHDKYHKHCCYKTHYTSALDPAQKFFRHGSFY